MFLGQDLRPVDFILSLGRGTAHQENVGRLVYTRIPLGSNATTTATTTAAEAGDGASTTSSTALEPEAQGTVEISHRDAGNAISSSAGPYSSSSIVSEAARSGSSIASHLCMKRRLIERAGVTAESH